MRIGYLECFSGISGDMLLGALIDAGVPLSLLEETVAGLNVGARLEARKVIRGGLAATKVDVLTGEDSLHPSEKPNTTQAHEHTHIDAHGQAHTHVHSHEHSHSHEREQQPAPGHSHAEHSHDHHRSLSTILGIISAAQLPSSVKERASRAFQMLGEAEAAIHSIPIENVHFHEVGAVDTIVDIVCSAAGAESLAIDKWMASPLNVGSGTVHCAHGTLPVPAPATLALLGDAPVYSAGQPMERVTPTGATILKMLGVEYGSLPAMRVKVSGYGAGGKETPGQPNLLRLLVGQSDDAQAIEPIAILETVIDDSSPQLLAYVSDLLLSAGAWDVYRVAVQMKKGRIGVQMTVLCRPDLVPSLSDLILRETTTIGLHWRLENKIALKREFAEASTEWGPVKIKVARWPSGQVANAAPEYEDCRRIAELHNLPLKHVMQEATRLHANASMRKREEADGPVKNRGITE